MELGDCRLSLHLFKVEVTSRTTKPGSRGSLGMQAHLVIIGWR